MTGWIGYTLAKSDRKFDEAINNGNRFPFKYDRRHCVDIVMNYQFSEKVDLSANWKYYSGAKATVAFQNTVIISPWSPYPDNNIVGYVESKNSFRLPSSHLLNLSANFHKKTKHGIRTWNVGIYNVYNNMNPMFIFADQYFDYPSSADSKEPTIFLKKEFKKITLLPIIPYFTYTYRF